MLEFLIPILAVVGAFASVFLIYVALQPSDFRIERTAEIGASADKLFPMINDLRQFNTWNPFAKADPQLSSPTLDQRAASARLTLGAGRNQVPARCGSRHHCRHPLSQ